jgi:hypothetical protein
MEDLCEVARIARVSVRSSAFTRLACAFDLRVPTRSHEPSRVLPLCRNYLVFWFCTALCLLWCVLPLCPAYSAHLNARRLRSFSSVLKARRPCSSK